MLGLNGVHSAMNLELCSLTQSLAHATRIPSVYVYSDVYMCLSFSLSVFAYVSLTLLLTIFYVYILFFFALRKLFTTVGGMATKNRENKNKKAKRTKREMEKGVKRILLDSDYFRHFPHFHVASYTLAIP